MNFFSLSVNHFAVSGTVLIFLDQSAVWVIVREQHVQSGSRNQMTTPKITVAMPSVRNNLEENQSVQIQGQEVFVWYHCHPESPPAPETVSNA